MSNPGVIFLSCVQEENIYFAVEDNIGEAIHIHLVTSFINIRMDFTTGEFLKLASEVELCLNGFDENELGFSDCAKKINKHDKKSLVRKRITQFVSCFIIDKQKRKNFRNKWR